MEFGTLHFVPVQDRLDLVAGPVSAVIAQENYQGIWVAGIDPQLADTAAFCERYGVGQEVSANCVIVEAKRGDKIRYAACMVLASTRADVNNTVRRQLDARKISFAPMETAVSLTGMEYGGINPIGLPLDWPILVDTRVAASEQVIIGSGIRKSKLLVPGRFLSALPGATTLDIIKPA